MQIVKSFESDETPAFTMTPKAFSWDDYDVNVILNDYWFSKATAGRKFGSDNLFYSGHSHMCSYSTAAGNLVGGTHTAAAKLDDGSLLMPVLLEHPMLKSVGFVRTSGIFVYLYVCPK